MVTVVDAAARAASGVGKYHMKRKEREGTFDFGQTKVNLVCDR